MRVLGITVSVSQSSRVSPPTVASRRRDHSAALGRSRGRPGEVNKLLAAGADAKAANRYGVTPLYLACENANAAIIERLLKAGADPNSASTEGETALMTVARTASSRPPRFCWITARKSTLAKNGTGKPR